MSALQTRVQQELLDVVDAGNRVVAQVPRGEVHRLGLRHRATHILVCNPAGEIFVQRRAWWKEDQPGRWDTSAAGHLDAGEDYLTAARRELQEELGILDAEALVPVCSLHAGPETGNEFVEVFALVTDARLQLDPEEIIDGRWCTSTALEAWLVAEPEAFTTTFREIWTRYRQR